VSDEDSDSGWIGIDARTHGEYLQRLRAIVPLAAFWNKASDTDRQLALRAIEAILMIETGIQALFWPDDDATKSIAQVQGFLSWWEEHGTGPRSYAGALSAWNWHWAARVALPGLTTLLEEEKAAEYATGRWHESGWQNQAGNKVLVVLRKAHPFFTRKSVAGRLGGLSRKLSALGTTSPREVALTILALATGLPEDQIVRPAKRSRGGDAPAGDGQRPRPARRQKKSRQKSPGRKPTA